MSHFFPWPVTKLEMWDFGWNKFEISGIYARSYKDFWLTAPLHQRIAVGSVSDIRYKKHAVIGFVVAETESETLTNVFIMFMKRYGRPKTAGRRPKRMTASETEIVVLRHLPSSGRPVTAVGPEMLLLAGPTVREDRHITSWQLALSLLVSKGSVGHIIRDLAYSKLGARWVSRSSTFEHKPNSCGTWSLERDFRILDCYSRWDLGPSFWTREGKKSMEWHHP